MGESSFEQKNAYLIQFTSEKNGREKIQKANC